MKHSAKLSALRPGAAKLLCWAVLLACSASAVSPSLAEDLDFSRDVLPILANKCFHCHGPDEATREADLRLDQQEAAVADRGGYAAIVPGEPDKSVVVERLFEEDPDLRMPPAASKIELTEAERAVLKDWISQGAEYVAHWSYVKPVRSPLPAVKRSDWPENPIDHFVLARLEAEGLGPSKPATRQTLIRRATLDLTGVPPTPEEVAAFLADPAGDEEAYARVVDRLLASPRYGQRMAWNWLDAARYADTDGFQGDPTRSMWPWRDHLVDSLNRNLPYDRFTIEALAGDLLPSATPEQVLATGFNRNHMYNGEGGRIAEETRVENVFDRTETTAAVWLGVTMTCCRCHDHKFDPIKQSEYYGLYAFFNNTSETGSGGTRGRATPSMPYLNPEQRTRLAQLETEIDELANRLDEPMPEVDQAQIAWEAETLAKLETFDKENGRLEMSPWRQLGPVPAEGGVVEEVEKALVAEAAAVDPEKKHAGEKFAWALREEYADAKVIDLPATIGSTFLYRTFETPVPRTVRVSLGSDDGLVVRLNGKELLSKNVPRPALPDQEFVDLDVPAGKSAFLLRIINTGGIAGFYFRKDNESVAGLPLAVADALRVPRDARNDAQRRELARWFRSQNSPEWQALSKRSESLTKTRDDLQTNAPAVMIMDELPEDRRRTTKVLYRGIYDKPTEETVTEHVPSFLHDLGTPEVEAGAEKRLDRLDLANWILSPENPLVARVAANRAWQTFFGKGIVSTAEDFGQTGEPPTHPELLDWLAVEYRDNGWDTKGLHRLIVTSATYRQSSSSHESLGDGARAVENDPENKLLWRAPRFRLPSWMLRDQALALGGLLIEKLDGPPVRPYQPEGVWEGATFGQIRYQTDTGEKLYRRSLYIFWRRIVGPTMLFDSAKRQTCEVNPNRTNTPLHALTTLNETAYVEAARAMATRILTEKSDGDVESRLRSAIRLATSREAQPQEIEILSKRVTDLTAHFESRPDDAKALLTVGESSAGDALPPAEHAAWTAICSVILNLDEVLSRE
ncbi:MAG TPA: PSD1 and planctomycete cytochrome C domain-containing protein [Pirellulaceae bacterium]|jgi:hypothetical protein|nr:PSD1 and planctomycete cytochrome C domain-containing protein [Pirellulaceae bacterium]